jgi:hypothetical protein
LEEALKILYRIAEINSQLLKNKLKPSDDLLVLEAQELTVNLEAAFERIIAEHKKHGVVKMSTPINVIEQPEIVAPC